MQDLETSIVNFVFNDCKPSYSNAINSSYEEYNSIKRVAFDAIAFTLSNINEIQELLRGGLESYTLASESEPVLQGVINNGYWRRPIQEGQYIVINKHGIYAIANAADILPLLKPF